MLYNEFWASLGYMRHCLKKKKSSESSFFKKGPKVEVKGKLVGVSPLLPVCGS